MSVIVASTNLNLFEWQGMCYENKRTPSKDGWLKSVCALQLFTQSHPEPV